MKAFIACLCVLLGAGALWMSISEDGSVASYEEHQSLPIEQSVEEIVSESKQTKPSKVTGVGPNQDNPLDLSKLNFDTGSTFSHISLTPKNESIGFMGYEVSENSKIYWLNDLGFMPGDTITHIEGKALTPSPEHFNALMKPYVDNETVFLTVNRNSEIIELEVDLN